MADKFPQLVQQIHAAGHEIGSHSYWHRLVYQLTPAEFREDLRRSLDALQQITGEQVRLYRAPSFSITKDSLWALELLAADPEVDATRLGCVGLSYGGRMSMLASAVSDRIRVAVCSGALNVMQERVRGRYSCGAQVIPGLLQYGDVPEIGSLIAPRPCLWEVGNKDGLMVQPWAGRAYERMQRAWAALGAADLLQIDRFEGAHRWNGEKAFPLLDQVLRPA